MFTHYDTQRLSQNFTVIVHIILILSKNALYLKKNNIGTREGRHTSIGRDKSI